MLCLSSRNRDHRLIKHEPLRFEELPKPGTLIAIDAEFVSMQQEETEYRSDGTKKVIRPARLSLARVSVLRGNGSKEGVPFIDDHIHTSEIIVDYLTEFSGIKCEFLSALLTAEGRFSPSEDANGPIADGDLDPTLSRYTLTPLKVVYKKLRLLVDSGCIFIGHGLSKDFRIISACFPFRKRRDVDSRSPRSVCQTSSCHQSRSSTPLTCTISRIARGDYRCAS